MWIGSATSIPEYQKRAWPISRPCNNFKLGNIWNMFSNPINYVCKKPQLLFKKFPLTPKIDLKPIDYL